MQRIDENTYIDDTLVTCAEYQLFIDEMREHGKYYQPDHWTSYQFPAGKARAPVRGVRHSDAVAFCEWLTEKEIREGIYRLPMDKEAVDYVMQSISDYSSIGYWTEEMNSAYKFHWISSIPLDARSLNPELNLINMQFATPVDLDLLIRELINLNRIFAQNTKIFRNLDLVSARDIALELGNALSGTRGFESDLVHILNRATDLRNFLDRVQVSVQENDMSRSINHIQDILDFIWVVRERIAGRSPAFEGIRLVKERIR